MSHTVDVLIATPDPDDYEAVQRGIDAANAYANAANIASRAFAPIGLGAAAVTAARPQNLFNRSRQGLQVVHAAHLAGRVTLHYPSIPPLESGSPDTN